MASLASAIRIPGIPDSSDGSTKEGDLYRQLERKNSNSIMNKIPRRLSFDGLRSRSSKKERTISGNEPLLRRKRSIFDKAENDEQSDQLSERRPSSQMSTKSGHPLALPSIRAFRTRFTVKDKSGGLLANAKADIARKEKSKMEGSRFMTARPASLGSYVGREYVAEMSKLMGTIRLMQDKPQALETQPIKEISAPFIPPNRPSHPPPPTHPRIEPRRSSLMDAVLSPNRQRVSRTPGMPLYERTNSSVLSPAQDDASVCDPVRSPLVASFSLDIVKPQKSRRSSLNDHFDIDVPSRKQSLTELRDAFVRMRSISDADLSISGSSEDKGIPPVPELDKALIKMKGSVSNTQSVGRDGDDEMSEAASGQGSQWETMSRSVTAISTLTTSTNLVEQLEKKQGTGWWSEARLQHGEIPSVPPAHETSEPDIQYHNIPVQRRNTGPRPSLVADSTWSSATGKSISESSAMSKQSDNQQSTSSLDEDATPTKRQAQKGPFVSNRISPALLERTLWLNKREASPRKMTAVTEVTELMGMIEGLKEKHSLETDVLLSALGGQKVEIKCLKDEVNSLQKTVKAGEDERELLRVEIRELTVALELERQIGKAIVAVDAKVTKSETGKVQFTSKVLLVLISCSEKPDCRLPNTFDHRPRLNINYLNLYRRDRRVRP